MIIDGKRKSYQFRGELFHCGTALTMDLIGGKWKAVIIWYLRHEKIRFSSLKRQIPDITEKMLSIQLKGLQADGIVHREQYGSKPPYRVEYSLTPFGDSLVPIIALITEWGDQRALEEGKTIEIEM